MESSHRWKHSASSPRVAGHRIKSFEPLTLDSAVMSPPRLGPPLNTFNYFEDTLEMARLHIAPAHCSSRKRQRRAGTFPIKGSRPFGKRSPTTMPASPLHRVVRPTADPGLLLHRQTDYWLIDAPVADHVSLSGPNHALAIDIRRKRGVHHI